MYSEEEDLPDELTRTQSGRVIQNPNFRGERMLRVMSGSKADKATDAMVNRAATEPLVRVDTGEMVDRFANMLSWENSEHPICLFASGMGDEVQGIQVMSLNPRFLDNYIKRDLQQSLEQQGLTLTPTPTPTPTLTLTLIKASSWTKIGPSSQMKRQRRCYVPWRALVLIKSKAA